MPPIKGKRFCPTDEGGCGAQMIGPNYKGTYSCPNNTGTCQLISCRFDRKGNNPHDIKWEGVRPLQGFQGDRRPLYEMRWDRSEQMTEVTRL